MARTEIQLALAAVLALGGACGGTQNPRDENLTADEHEAEADREEGEAERHETHYRGVYYGTELYNPTDAHIEESRTHRAHADAHRARAGDLRVFQEAECAAFPEETRASCPLLLGLLQVEDVDGGSRLTFAEGVDIEPVVAHIRCHIAFAAAQGREGIDHCALYVPGAQVTVEGNVVVLVTDQRDQVEDLRRRANLQAPASE